ncbi:MAG: hypothetical protein HOP12_14320, partial [Candidatus Eisenbacteria bacterium]|nr:hypothetical protein [Candidatus Eisenbacteria bacterium]
MRWRSIHTGLLLCLAALLPAASARSAGPPPSTLEGHDLEVADELGTGVESALGSLLSGQMAGEITRVTVNADEGSRITVRVSYSGFEGGRMWAEALNSNRKLQSWITASTPQSLGASSGEVEFVLDAGDRAPEGGSRASSFLRLSVARGDRSVASFRRNYRMAKTWGAIAGEPTALMTTTIMPKPIGTTATLTEAPSYPLPPRSGVATAPA